MREREKAFSLFLATLHTMLTKRRKKPLDPFMLSLLLKYLCSLVPSVPVCTIFGHTSQFLELGKLVRFDAGPARSSGAAIVQPFLCLTAWPWVSINSVSGCRPTSFYSTAVCPALLGQISSALRMRISVRALILLKFGSP